MDETDRISQENRIKLLQAQKMGKMGSWEWEVLEDRVEHSPQNRELFGFDPHKDPLTFQDFMARVHPDDRERLLSHKTRKKMPDGLFENNFRIVRPDGEIRYVRQFEQDVYDDQGRKIKIIGTSQDVTDIRVAEQKLRALQQELEQKVKERTRSLSATNKELQTTKHRLELALWASNEGMWEWDIRADDMEYDSLFMSLIGYAPDKLEPDRESWLSLIHEEDREAYMDEMRALKEGRKDFVDSEIRVLHQKGHWIWILWRGKVVSTDQRGKPNRAIGTIRDITETKEIQEQLTIARDKAQNAIQAKNAFFSNINHELRTPLTVIMGMAETLLSEVPEEKALFPRSIMQYAQHLLQLISDIQDLSKMEEARMELDEKPFSLSQLLDTLEKGMAFKAEEKAIRFSIHPDKLLPSVIVGDPIRISQILYNLIDNAIKYTAHGKVSLHVRTKPSSKGSMLQFIVRDTGIGIDDEKIDSIFERYSQATAAIRKKHGGTGLGLNISRQLAEMMGGMIEAQSELGKGSIFTFSLPLQPDKTS